MEDSNINEFRKRVLNGEFASAIAESIKNLNLKED